MCVINLTYYKACRLQQTSTLKRFNVVGFIKTLNFLNNVVHLNLLYSKWSEELSYICSDGDDDDDDDHHHDLLRNL